MFDFSFGKKSAVGIDIGNSSIKIVELALKKEKPHLTNYAWMDVPDLNQKEGENQSFFETIASEYIKKILKTAKIKCKKAFFSMQSYDGLVTLIDFPKMPQEEIDQAIKFEAQKYIPASLEDVVLSWQIFDEVENPLEKEMPGKATGKKDSKILLVAFSKKKAQEYGRIAANAKIALAGIEIETMALAKSLVGDDKGNFLIVDIGCRVCNIILIKKGKITLNRNIDAGGEDLTVAISKAMGIAKKRAEDIKISGKNFFSADSNLHFSTVDIITGEISRIINSQGNADLDSIILSGGTANFPGLAGFFQNKFGKKTLVGNPFSRVEFDKQYERNLIKIAPRFSVATGMALLGIEQISAKHH
jgi:type IV pilus assembly protein PilM